MKLSVRESMLLTFPSPTLTTHASARSVSPGGSGPTEKEEDDPERNTSVLGCPEEAPETIHHRSLFILTTLECVRLEDIRCGRTDQEERGEYT